MPNYNQVSYGSKGSDVTELQKLLNKNGYKLTEDGIFGKNTQSAVKDYQKKNNLSVDGIAGKNTWGALTKATSTTPSAPTTPATPEETKAPTFEYKPSGTVEQAEALLQQQLAQKPGAYQSTWDEQVKDTIAQILNREKFSYDLNGDALYQQYKDQYTMQGKLAMMDTMGQAAAMTGGYGNSFAQAVGQQAYQNYLQQLNDVVPELYGMAQEQHNQETQNLYNQAGLMAQMEDQDYSRYMDHLTNYYTELGMAQDEARYQAEQDYSKWADDLSFLYGQYRDSVADEQWQAQFDEAKRQYDEQVARSSNGSGGGGGGGGGKTFDPSKVTGNLSAERIKQIQYSLGVPRTGVWDEATYKASGYYDMNQAWDAYSKGNSGVSKNAELMEGNKINAQIKGKSDAEKEKMIRDAYENGTIDAEMAGELLRVNGLL